MKRFTRAGWRSDPSSLRFGLAALLACAALSACNTTGPGTVGDTRHDAPRKPALACADLAKAGLSFEGNATVVAATAVTGGSITLASGQTISNLPTMCRVEGVARPRSDSDIRFEVWLPIDRWNGRFMASGEGGFAGALNYTRGGLDGGLDEIVRRGYATASTDTGHRAADQFWAIGHPERVTDYAYRAKHLVTVAAKGLIATYYGQAPVKSYLNSCSNGGRQALVQANRYPADYDGFVIGAPWNYTQRAAAGFLWTAQALSQPGAAIPATKLPIIRNAVLAKCDAIDGLKDGLIEDPRRCGFDPATLQCKGADAADCLTSAQVTAVRKLYQGPVNPRTGEQLYPGWSQGSESMWGRIVANSPTSSPLALGIGYYQNLVYSDPKWDFMKFDFDRDMTLADEKMSPVLNAMQSDLSAIRDRGVKIIFYQGWDDEVLQPGHTPNYYEQVTRTMGGPESTQRFARLFMVPGMGHCYFGPGASSFGGVGQQITPTRDPAHDLQSALEKWVENGVAPDTMIATKFTDNAAATRSVKLTRLLCTYPKVARYKGQGSPDDSSSFECVNPASMLR